MTYNIESQLLGNISEFEEQIMRISFLGEDISLVLSEKHKMNPDINEKIIYISPSFIEELSDAAVETLDANQYLNLLESLLESVKNLIQSNINNLHNKGLMRHIKNCYNKTITTMRAEVLDGVIEKMIEASDPDIA